MFNVIDAENRIYTVFYSYTDEEYGLMFITYDKNTNSWDCNSCCCFTPSKIQSGYFYGELIN